MYYPLEKDCQLPVTGCFVMLFTGHFFIPCRSSRTVSLYCKNLTCPYQINRGGRKSLPQKFNRVRRKSRCYNGDVSTMFKKMDEKIEETLTPQARHQKRKRVLGSVISQPADTPKWAVAETD